MKAVGAGVSEEKEEAETGSASQKRKSWPAWRVVVTDFVIVVLGVGVANVRFWVKQTLMIETEQMRLN
jgi:hypothetical protein